MHGERRWGQRSSSCCRRIGERICSPCDPQERADLKRLGGGAGFAPGFNVERSGGISVKQLAKYGRSAAF